MGHWLKMRPFNGECAQFIFNKCLIYTLDGASAKFRINSHETDNSEVVWGQGAIPSVQLAPIQMFTDDISSHISPRPLNYQKYKVGGPPGTLIIKRKSNFPSFKRKFRVEQLQ
jgi:hypothetical protein